jgi:hypothetical protein
MLAAENKAFSPAIERARGWLLAQRPAGVLDAAAILWGVESSCGDAPTDERKATGEHCLKILIRGQSADGGWGPFVSSPPEVFDTAVSLLALSSIEEQRDAGEMIRRGRKYLIARQLEDGSWPATTRPSGGESYSQTISTTAWAAISLIATGDASIR